jgi:hypothetical protein
MNKYKKILNLDPPSSEYKKNLKYNIYPRIIKKIYKQKNPSPNIMSIKFGPECKVNTIRERDGSLIQHHYKNNKYRTCLTPFKQHLFS